MKYFLISDNVDTLAGMRLVGVHGVVVHEEDEVRAALEKACADEEIALCSSPTSWWPNAPTPCLHTSWGASAR